MKKVIRLTENQLHNVITESVRSILKEYDLDDFELPRDWYRNDARRDAIHDIVNTPEAIKDKEQFCKNFERFYVSPNTPYSIVNDDGEEITYDDIKLLRGNNKYNNEKRRENSKHKKR